MENYPTPSAPPEFSYPLLTTQYFYENKVGTYQVEILNYQCLYCDSGIDSSTEPVVRMACKHAAHFKCIESHLRKSNNCHKCTDSKEEEEDIGIAIDKGDDPEFTKKMEEKFGLNELKAKLKHYEGRELASSKRTALIGATPFWKTDAPKKVTYDVLAKSNKTFDDIIDAKVTIAECYYHIGIRDYNDLLSLGFKKKHFLKYAIGNVVDYLTALYFVSYRDLHGDLDITLDDLFENGIDCKGLYRLGLNLQSLMENGLNLNHFIKARQAGVITMHDWVNEMGLKTRHMKLLGFNSSIIVALQWDPFDLGKMLKFTDNDYIHFKIDVSTLKKKKTAKA